jgi:hypothetical protein
MRLALQFAESRQILLQIKAADLPTTSPAPQTSFLAVRLGFRLGKVVQTVIVQAAAGEQFIIDL